jgi:heat shock protein HtpX
VTLLPVVSTSVLLVMPWVAIPLSTTLTFVWWPYVRLSADDVLLFGATLIVSLYVVVFCLVVLAGFLIDHLGARMVLRAAHARPVTAADEPALVRVVENLCLAAGLPQPTVHVVESEAPNALATGSNPSDASLVVTRGLLTLLTRRELQAVVAHELSHIGNHDIRLSTTLATLVTVASLPWKMFARVLDDNAMSGASLMGVLAALTGLTAVAAYVYLVREIFSDVLAAVPGALHWWKVHAITAPVYAVCLSPVVALLIRTIVARQREFLADAEAVVLTRDPEGLALALVKIGSARGEPLRVGEGVVHLYFVDPVSLGPRIGAWWRRRDASLLRRLFPSHPPLAERIELLARMGSGIDGQALEAAVAAGAALRDAEAEPEPFEVPAPEPDDAVRPDPPKDVLIPLYERPDGWSRVLAQLPQDAQVTLVGTEGPFDDVVDPFEQMYENECPLTDTARAMRTVDKRTSRR